MGQYYQLMVSDICPFFISGYQNPISYWIYLTLSLFLQHTQYKLAYVYFIINQKWNETKPRDETQNLGVPCLKFVTFNKNLFYILIIVCFRHYWMFHFELKTWLMSSSPKSFGWFLLRVHTLLKLNRIASQGFLEGKPYLTGPAGLITVEQQEDWWLYLWSLK